MIYNVYDRCLRVIYPQTCYFCGKISKTPICGTCLDKVEYSKEPCCKKCGKPLLYAETEYCQDCKKKEMFFEQGKSVWVHKGPAAWSIYQFKYHNRRVFGDFYAKEMWRVYGRKIREWEIDAIIPIPIHWRRKRSRGFNQAEIVAKRLGKYADLPVLKRVIYRCRYTKRQKELNYKERKKNLRGAFRVKRKWKPVKNVLLIDDIYTTGNTINEAARVLKEHGVEKIMFLTISIGQGF